MAAFINTNTASLNAQRNLNSSQGALATSLQRLSSGLRINSAKDDAAGLAISERMTSQIRGNDQAARNANDGISMVQTAEGDMAQIGSNLQRMRELAVQSSNASNSQSDRAALDGEVQALASEIDRVAQNSSFNGVKLLDGGFTNKSFQIGANNTANDRIDIASIASARTSDLGQYTGFNQQNIGAITYNATPAALSIAQGGGASISLGNVANDAKSIAAAINGSGVQGLTATADAAVANGTTAGAAFTTAGTVKITINNTVISMSAVASQTTTQANTMAAINAQSANTGVVATDTGSGLKLTAADGRNIAVSNVDLTTDTAAGVTLGQLGLAVAGNATTTGAVRASFVATTGSPVTSMTMTSTAIATTAIGVGKTGTALSATNVLTDTGAKNALTSIDAALATISTTRASLGAYQNRFTSVVTSLQTTSENLSASRSRIQDTDFAHETASLTRGQILQQAGTAMLAQANSLPNGVLALLRG